MGELIMKGKGIISLVFLMVPYFMSGYAIATDEIVSGDSEVGINFGGELIQTTCDVRFDDDLLIMDPIGVDDFSEQQLSALRKNFSLRVENCILSPITVSKIQISFDSLATDGKAAPGVFTNQAINSFGQRSDNGVGFAVYDQRDNENVLTPSGESRVLNYQITSSTPLDIPREFYVKYRQTGADVTAGQVTATLLVSAFYD